MIARILFAIAILSALFLGKDLIAASNTHGYDAIVACLLALFLAPWLKRQFD